MANILDNCRDDVEGEGDEQNTTVAFYNFENWRFEVINPFIASIERLLLADHPNFVSIERFLHATAPDGRQFYTNFGFRFTNSSSAPNGLVLVYLYCVLLKTRDNRVQCIHFYKSLNSIKRFCTEVLGLSG